MNTRPLPWVVVILLLFACMCVCSSAMNMFSSAKRAGPEETTEVVVQPWDVEPNEYKPIDSLKRHPILGPDGINPVIHHLGTNTRS